jgi:glyoxalase family protein
VPIQGLHHVHLICADAERTTHFYTQVLGLKRMDTPMGVDLCVTDAANRSGTSLEFLARPSDPHGRRGVGATHHVALAVPDKTALRKWKRRLEDLDIDVQGPYDRKYFQCIYFRDPDGVILELATLGPGWTEDEPSDQLGTTIQPPPDPHIFGRRDERAIIRDTWPNPVPEIAPDFAVSGLHHVTAICSDIERTSQFYCDLLGLRLVKKTYNFDNPKVPHWYLGSGQGMPGTIIAYFGEGEIGTRSGQLGRGLTHHISFAAADLTDLIDLRARMVEAGLPVSKVTGPPENQSVRFHDPDGHCLAVTLAR